MSPAARSVLVFSIYLDVLGLVLIVAPNLLLSLFRIAETNEVWIRVVGMLVLILGYYYWTAARHELTAMLRATVVGRTAVLVFFVAYAVAGLGPATLVLFGVIDVLGAAWTGAALRASP
jgi:hypothetical protein